jgi:hypothetical protein
MKSIIFLLFPVQILIAQTDLSTLASDSNHTNTITNLNWEINWNDSIAIAVNNTNNFIDTIYESYHIVEEDTDCSASPLYIDDDFTMLSVVGSYISYEEKFYSDGGCLPHGTANFNYKTYDLNKQKVQLLTELWDEQQILPELLKVKIIKEYLTRCTNDIDSLAKKGFKVVMDCLNNFCEDVYFDDLLENYAFYNVSDNNVTIRFGLPHCSEFYRGSFTEFEITLPIPGTLGDQFKKAKTDQTLMINLNL